LRLSPKRLEALARRQAHNPEAYDAYLQGRYYWNLFTPVTSRKADECYQRATQLDPNYALAWSGLADAFASTPIHADARPNDFWVANLQAAQACEQLGEDALALESLSRGASVGGENSKVIALRGYLLAKTGRKEEARNVLKTLEALSRERYMPVCARAMIHTG